MAYIRPVGKTRADDPRLLVGQFEGLQAFQFRPVERHPQACLWHGHRPLTGSTMVDHVVLPDLGVRVEWKVGRRERGHHLGGHEGAGDVAAHVLQHKGRLAAAKALAFFWASLMRAPQHVDVRRPHQHLVGIPSGQ